MEGCVVPPDPGIGGRGDQLMLQAGRRGGDLESGWVLVGFEEHPK